MNFGTHQCFGPIQVQSDELCAVKMCVHVHAHVSLPLHACLHAYMLQVDLCSTPH